MKSIPGFLACIAFALVAPLTACDDTMSPQRDILRLALAGVEPLANGFHYEGWAITASGPVSTGKFNVGSSGALVTVNGTTIANGEFPTDVDLDAATAIVITIEPAGDVDAVPAATKILAGALANRSASLQISATQALGTGFAGFDVDSVAVEMSEALAALLVERVRPISVRICLHPRDGSIIQSDAIAFFEEVARRVPMLGSAPARSAYESARDVSDDAVDAPESAGRRVPRIFISYAHEDRRYKDELGKLLRYPVREGKVIVWDDGEITAGADWDDDIRRALFEANIVIMLISSDFVGSAYIDRVELAEAVEREQRGETRIVPIIVRRCIWEERTGLSRLQALPVGGKPISDWSSRDHAWTNVDEGLTKLIDSFQSIAS